MTTSILSATEKLYSAEGQKLINDLPVPGYLAHAEKRLREENERLLHYLDQSSKWQLVHTVEKQLLALHLSSILSKGLDCLLEENRTEDLQLMYNLLGRVKSGQQELCNKMAEYVKKRGKVIVINPEKDKTMVQELLDFKEKLDNILKCCFSNNEKFITSLKVDFSLQNMNRIIDYFPSGRFREFHKSETKQAGRNDCQVCRFKVASWQQRSK